jgi:DNA-binding winged helix-turn-helix (wHTH) protein
MPPHALPDPAVLPAIAVPDDRSQPRDRRHGASASTTQSPRLRFGAFTFDPASGELIGARGPVVLRRQATAVLRELVLHAPAIITFDALLDAVWRRRAVSPSALPQAIRAVRRALHDPVRGDRYIETRHRVGYRFAMPVHAIAVLAGWVADDPVQNACSGRFAFGAGFANPVSANDAADFTAEALQQPTRR